MGFESANKQPALREDSATSSATRKPRASTSASQGPALRIVSATSCATTRPAPGPEWGSGTRRWPSSARGSARPRGSSERGFAVVCVRRDKRTHFNRYRIHTLPVLKVIHRARELLSRRAAPSWREGVDRRDTPMDGGRGLGSLAQKMKK